MDTNKKAFTLIEILVSIVILGMITGLLLPVFLNVRIQGRKVTCLNNLRQHGIAWSMYLDEHDSFFPPWGWPPQADGRVYGDTFGGKRGSYLMYDWPQGDARYRTLNKYLEIYDEGSPNLEIFHCPADLKKPYFVPSGYSGMEVSYFDYFGTSYSINERLVFPSRLRLSDVTYPHSKVILEMDHIRQNPGHTGKDYVAGQQFPTPVLFVDGHVAWVSYDSDYELNNINSDKKVFIYPYPGYH